jgi:hypothetical protein
MSSISGVGASQPSLLDQIKAQQDPANQANQQQGWNAKLEDLLKGAGVDPAKLPALEQQIQDAATSARQSATGDPRTAVKAAVDKVLQANGVDPAKLQASAKPKKGKGHHGHHTKPAATGSGVAAATTGATSPLTSAQNTLTGVLTTGQVDVEG